MDARVQLGLNGQVLCEVVGIQWDEAAEALCRDSANHLPAVGFDLGL